MQTVFIEENLNHQQIINLCQFIDSYQCKSLEFRRCTISDLGFNELMKSLIENGKSIISLIFNIQMISEHHRLKKFIEMLAKCPNLVNLRVHGNNINDDMFTELCTVLHENCLKLALLDIGDNRLTNKSIVHLCTLIVPDGKRSGLEELIISANRLITNAGWTELFFSIAFNSRIRRLALDYNILDSTTAVMLTMIIASSQTLAYLDLECCNLNEYVGQLFLTLFTKYPVKLEELYLEKNPAMLENTRQLINECLSLKSRRNSISSEQLLTDRLSIRDNDATSTDETINDDIEPVKLKKIDNNKKKNNRVKQPTKIVHIKEELKPVTFIPIKNSDEANREEEEEIEELLPIEIGPYGTAGQTLYWNRI